MDRRNTNRYAVDASTRENADHSGWMEQAIQVEEGKKEVVTTPPSGVRNDKQPEGSASGKIPSRSRPNDNPIQSASHVNQGFRESEELDSLNQKKGSELNAKNAQGTKRAEVKSSSTDLPVSPPEVPQEENTSF